VAVPTRFIGRFGLCSEGKQNRCLSKWNADRNLFLADGVGWNVEELGELLESEPVDPRL
jgi:hypothetical protein